MLFFGHIGITAGVVRACEMLCSISEPAGRYEPESGSRFAITFRKKRLCLHRLLGRIGSQAGATDYRLVIMGSMLPDIIDKPLWFFTGGDIFPSGRDYGHTFLFNLVLLICGLILLKYRKSWLLVISSCSFMHLILDQIWKEPLTLWWPLLGPLQKAATTGWVSDTVDVLAADASVYIPEIIGLAVILLLGYRLLVRKSIINFIKTGAID